ncbi:hypothetical protein L2I57_025915 [Tychonema sp. BBK16]
MAVFCSAISSLVGYGASLRVFGRSGFYPISVDTAMPTRGSATFKDWYNLHLAPLSISLLWTGRMPIPQENSLFVEQASCLLLIIVQDVIPI